MSLSPSVSYAYANQLRLFIAHLLALVFIAIVPCAKSSAETLLREDFNDLSKWHSVEFDKIPRHSVYRIVADPLDKTGGTMLALKSDSAASALVNQTEFSVAKFPIIRWRWKVDKLLTNADPKTKSGDDYPIRIYLVFKYDPKMASLFERLKYSSLKSLKGEYPPYSSLSYVWSSVTSPTKTYESPYTSRARIMPLRSGASGIGQWQDEEVNAFKDYQNAFGEDPPVLAALAIMTDSDNSKESTSAAIKFIEVKGGVASPE